VNATIASEKLADFRARLPRLADLHDRFHADSPKNFFRCFPSWFDESEVTLRLYEQIERDLSFVPPSEWNAFAAKVGAMANRYDEGRRREWEQLFNVFSEALGARVLVEKYGCDVLRLVSTADGKTCDWFGSAAGQPHYLEVKTLNHSDDERKSWYNEAELVHTTFAPAALLAKARSTYDYAKTQLDAMPGAAEARKLILFVVHADYNFDPLFGDTVRESLLREFEKFEDPKYFIHLAVNTPNDD
jgi:hypothetical protein